MNQHYVPLVAGWQRRGLLSLWIYLLLTCGVFAQERAVSGRVLSGDDNKALPGVSVAVKGTTRGTTTDANGDYRISVPDNQAALVFSAVGFVSQELTVGNQSTVNLTLTTDTRSLNEVVVVGYGTQKKSQLTGAISSVTPKQITEQPITNLGQALQGRVAGVDVSQSGSLPGSVPSILIRGRRSFNAGNDPLYVVDGIPLSADYQDFNPNDVASMEVLKDATSTAIYGARGANGVILITTKRGAQNGRTVISLDTYAGVSDALGKVNLMNGAQYAELKRESRRTIGTYNDANGNPIPTGVADPYADSKLFEAVELEGIAQNRTTDYQSMILRQGFQQNHSLGVQGGNDRTQFYINGAYFRDKGIVIGQDYTRMSLRANLDHQINRVFRVGLSSYGMYSLQNGSNLSTFSQTLQQNPLAKARDDQGNLIFNQTTDALLSNPLAEIVPGAQVDAIKKYRIFNALYIEANILKGLTYRVNFGPDFIISRAGRFIGAQTNANQGSAPTATTQNGTRFNYTLENIVTYNRAFGDHSFAFTGLQSIQRENFETYGNSVLGIPVETQQFYNLGNASTVLGVNSGLVQWTINSYMGRVNYDYKDRFLVTATIRRDGSSRFGANYKYGNFPGVAVAWNISNERFLKSTAGWLDQLKLRASRGVVGNQGLSPYQTQGLLAQTAYAWNNTSAFGYWPNTIGNPNLRWESSTTTNAGVDFSLWRGRVAGSLELYQTNTTNLLLSDQLPTSTGFNAVTRNVGATRNRGIELSLSTVNVNTRGGFKWTTDWVFYKNKEAIVSLYNGAVDDPGNKWFIGQPLNVFYDYKKVGIWQTNEADAAKAAGFQVGQIKVQDTNGDGKITAADRVILGSDIPSWTGSLTNRFTFKGFDLSFLAFARVGQMIQSGLYLNNLTLQGRYNQLVVNYWTPNNPTNDYPRPNFNQERPAYNTTLSYFDGSFVKVRNINFGYTFPTELAGRLRLQSLRLYCSIQQPFIFAPFRSKYNGIDPETATASTGAGAAQQSNNTTPATRITTIGLNVRF